MILARLRDQAATSPSPRSALRRADLLRDALGALRRTNPNRQLLLEALLLQMART